MTAGRRQEVGFMPPEGRGRQEWVIALLERQLGLYGELRALSRRQGALIEADETERLLGVLGERQLIVDEITDLGRRLDPIRDGWDGFLAGLEPAAWERVRVLIDDLSDMAAEIAERDEADRALLERRRDAAGAEISGVARGRSAVAAYGRGAGRGPLFQDREV